MKLKGMHTKQDERGHCVIFFSLGGINIYSSAIGVYLRVELDHDGFKQLMDHIASAGWSFEGPRLPSPHTSRRYNCVKINFSTSY